MPRLLIFGPGYTGGRLRAEAERRGWTVEIIDRQTNGVAIRNAIGRASHIVSTVPPSGNEDPILAAWGDMLTGAPAAWIGYLSSTGVYGDTGGGWVDESAPIGTGRRAARSAADLAWQALHAQVRVFRLPGIYGPGRSVLDRLREGKAHRIDLAGQVFSRVHVDDIIGGLFASLEGPPGVYNLADDQPCAQNRVIEQGAALLGQAPPPLLTLEEAALSPAAQAFYSENRRVANGKAKRLLGWRPAYPTYREGLAACL